MRKSLTLPLELHNLINNMQGWILNFGIYLSIFFNLTNFQRVNQHQAMWKLQGRMKETFWLWQDNGHVTDLCQKMVFVSASISPTHVKDSLMSHWVGTLGTTTSSHPISLSWSIHLRAGESNFSIHTRYLPSLPKFYSVLFFYTCLFFSSFFQKFRTICIYQNSPWVSRAAGPRYFPARDVRAHSDVSLGINTSRGHAEICRREKNKITYVQFVWGVRQNSVGS